MKSLRVLTASAALVALTMPAVADCAGHDVTAEVKSETVVTAERDDAATPQSATGQATIVEAADEAETRG